jgi:hypothetical protein
MSRPVGLHTHKDLFLFFYVLIFLFKFERTVFRAISICPIMRVEVCIGYLVTNYLYKCAHSADIFY